LKRALLAALLILIVAPTTLATISNETCYNQCAAWKFYFQNDLCWAWFEEQCVMDEEDVLDTAVNFMMDMSEGTAGIDTIATAFHCAELIDGCLAPILRTCRQNCAERTGRYAPNLDVIETFYGRNNPGIFYNEDTHKLHLVVTNDGLSYAKPVSVTVKAGSTLSHDKQIRQWTTVFSGQTPGMVPMDATIQPVGSKNTWEQTIDWTAVPDAYNEVRIIVDSENLVEEGGESDNSYTQVIDLLPTVADINIDHTTKTQNDLFLEQATVTVFLKNGGDETGDYRLKIYKQSVKPENFVMQETGTMTGHSQKSQDFDFDLTSDNASIHGTTLSYYAVIEKDGVEVDRQWFYLKSYAGFIKGHVVDSIGRPLQGAHVCTNTQQCADTDSNGRYSIRNLRLTQYDYTVTASHTSIDKKSSQHVTLTIDRKKTSQDGLEAYDVDFVLGSTPGKLTIDCTGAMGEMDYFVTSADAAYSGSSTIPAHITSMMPGSYNVTLIKRGVAATTGKIDITAGADARLQLDCSGTSPQAAYDYAVTAPTLAWNVTVEGLPGAVSISRNGKVIIAYTRVPGKFDKSRLYAFDNDGKQLWTIQLPSTKGQDRTWVGTSDDGKRTLLCIVEPETTMAHIYDDKGQEVASADMGDHSASVCVFSPDGQYAYASGLRDGMLKEISGGDVTNREGSAEGLYTQDAEFFDEALRPNMVLSSCDGGLCEMSFDRTVQRTFATKYPIVASQTALRHKTAIATKEGIDFYDGTSKSWTVPIEDYPYKLSISPAGGFVALMQHNPTNAFKVYANGKDITPPYKISMTAFNFRFTDIGLYAITGKTNALNLYVFGKPQEKDGKTGKEGKNDGKTGKDPTKPGSTGTSRPSAGDKPTAEQSEKPGIVSRIVDWFKDLLGIGG
jgi:hypothetical protein